MISFPEKILDNDYELTDDKLDKNQLVIIKEELIVLQKIIDRDPFA